MELNLDKIEEIYSKARTVLLQLGEESEGFLSLKKGRLQISGAKNNSMLSVYFYNKENSGSSCPSTCLTVSSNGRLKHYSEPCLSEKEAGEGEGREGVYLPWINWLNRLYLECNDNP